MKYRARPHTLSEFLFSVNTLIPESPGLLWAPELFISDLKSVTCSTTIGILYHGWQPSFPSCDRHWR